MSYEKVIGFGVDKNKPKAMPFEGRPHESELMVFKKMGVEPIFVNMAEHMPDNVREPEQKLFFRDVRGFHQAREIITNAKNAFMIPGQVYEDKNPLTSILVDSTCAHLDKGNYTLRYRFEMDYETGAITQGDFNEKSGMKGGNIVGGCVDRFERELEQKPGESLDHGFEAFKAKYRRQNSPAFSDGVSFNQLRVGAGYQCARNEVGVAFKHPIDDVMFVFEVCEDFWHDTMPDIEHSNHKYYEWEFEVKQVWGKMPTRLKSKEDFKEYVYSAMTMFRDHMHANIPHSTINMKSKAEIAKENLEFDHGLTEPHLAVMGLTSVFQYAINLGGDRTLQQVMNESHGAIYRMGRILFEEKERYNETALQPSADTIGYGTSTIPYSNDNEARTKPRSRPDYGQQPVAVPA